MLQRDIRDLANISDLAAVPRLLSAVAARAGGLLNFRGYGVAEAVNLELDSAGDILLAHGFGARSRSCAGGAFWKARKDRGQSLRHIERQRCARAAGTGKYSRQKMLRDIVLYTGTEIIPLARNLHGIPVTHLLAG